MEKLIEMRDKFREAADALDDIITADNYGEQTEDKQEEIIAKFIVKMLEIQRLADEI